MFKVAPDRVEHYQIIRMPVKECRAGEHDIALLCLGVYTAISSKYFLERELNISVKNGDDGFTLYISVSTDDTFNTLLKKISARIPDNNWIGIQNEVQPVSFCFDCNENNIFRQVLSKSLHIVLDYEAGAHLILLDKNDGLAGVFEYMWDQLVPSPDTLIQDKSLIEAQQQEHILRQWSRKHAVFPPVNAAIDLIREQAKAHPDKEALVFKDRRITYSELLSNSEKIASYLMDMQVQREQLIGIFIEQSVELVFCILGIHLAGAAYIAFDPEHGSERLTKMADSSGIQLFFCSRQTEHVFLSQKAMPVLVDDVLNKEYTTETLNIQNSPSGLAYVMFTSGSTGNMKAVMIEHRSIVNQVYVVRQRYQLSLSSRVLVQSSPAFDSYVSKLFPVLSCGGTLVLMRKQDFLDIDCLKQTIKNENITYLTAPPSMIALLNEHPEGFGQLKYIGAGGEVLKYNHINNLLGKVRIFNVYGPTEITVSASCYELNVDEIYNADSLIPIGKPNPNYTIYILDRKLRCVAVGCPGELYIGGVGVARGYLNNAKATREKFIEDPFCEGNVLYRTGDLGMWDQEGNIVFIGRSDTQVKINGHRVELEEIELVLSSFSGVQDASVIYEKCEGERQELTAYLLCSAQSKIKLEKLISYARKFLPGYMVPYRYVKVQKGVFTTNGKLNKQALLSMPGTHVIEIRKEDGYVAPGSVIEQDLSAIWKELLGVEKVGIYDNFFEMGVDSLKSMRAVSMIRKRLELDVRIRELFYYPTIAQLADHLKARPGKAVLIPPVVVHQRPGLIPLSFNQERLWFIDQLESSVQYHVSSVLKLKGELNRSALKFAFESIINRHEVLRTVIEVQDGRAYQRILEKNIWQLPVADHAGQDNSNGLKQYIQQFIERPFDLSKDFMLRAELISTDSREHVLVLVLHHIAVDGWSMAVLARELKELYTAYAEGSSPTLKPLSIQYADYAIWQRTHISGAMLEADLQYWKEKLQDIEPLNLRADYPRPPVQSTKGAVVNFSIEKELYEQLQLLAQEQNATLFMVLFTTFNVLMYYYSGQNDICVGSAVAGRMQPETEALIGFFINTVALRNQVKGEASFNDFLQEVKSTLLQAYEHQDAPFEKVVQTIIKERDLSRNAFFQVMFVLHNQEQFPLLQLDNIQTERQPFISATSKFDLTFSLIERAHEIEGQVEYCTDLYQAQTIERMIAHYKVLLHSIVRSPRQKIDGLSMLTHHERHRLLHEFNDSTGNNSGDETIVSLFEKQAETRPDSVAVEFEGRQLTYRQLNERSNQFGHYLRSLGVNGQTLVPVCMEKSLQMLVAILGILKAGGAYVPIDPAYPCDRISYILEDTNATMVISDSESRSKLPVTHDLKIIIADDPYWPFAKQPVSRVPCTTQNDHIAYVIYTSGSTGRPKGVMIRHKAVTSLVVNTNYISLSPNNVLLSTGSPSFDATTFEYWGMLLNGGNLILCAGNSLLDCQFLKKTIKTKGVTRIWFTSSWFNQIVDADITVFESLKTILVGGEQLSEHHIQQVRKTYPFIEIINGYGPTENTCFSLTYKIKDINRCVSVPIGSPVRYRSAYILGKFHQLMPVGVAGEICVGGEGVAIGYLNNEALTGQKFIQDVFNKRPGSRLYKTGDCGRWLPDGNIEFLGRMDDQVKIRGYRVEPGEIESMLLQSGLVRQVVVLAKKDEKNNKQLIGYVVCEEGRSLNKEEIRAYLQSKLPAYMVPQYWVETDALPLTPNGKINKKALLDLDAGEQPGNEYVAPGNALEKDLCLIWKNLLGAERIGIDDNFFQMGGNSLITIQVVNQTKRCGYILHPKDIFTWQTIRALSTAIKKRAEINATDKPKRLNVKRTSIVAIQEKGDNPPFFVIPGFLLYKDLSYHLGEKQPVYGFEPFPYKNIEEVAAQFIAEMKDVRPLGPYYLGAYCGYAPIIFEMANKLMDEGETVPLVVLFESYGPDAILSKRSLKYINKKIRFYFEQVRGASFSNALKFILEQIIKISKHFYGKLRSFRRTKSKYKSYPGRVILFKASITSPLFTDDPMMGWSKYLTGEMEVLTVAGDHLGILKDNVAVLAEKLSVVLEQAKVSVEIKT